MKRLLIHIAAVLVPVFAMAQAPQKFNFQALVRNSSNELVYNKQVTVISSITDELSNVVYSEKQMVETDGSGIATIVVGGGTPESGSFSEIDWSVGSYYLQTSIDIGEGTISVSSISPLLSVPYALYTEKAGKDYYSKAEIDTIFSPFQNESNVNLGTVKIVDGAIQAPFSVSKTKKVYFSMGNLQYQASTGTWRFAEPQFYWCDAMNCNINATYMGWIDLFGAGTSGYAGAYPYNSDEKDAYGCISISEYDWGVYNAISNGGNKAGMWRVLNSVEWRYLLNRNSRQLYSIGQVAGVHGLILLPDDWTTPSSLQFTPVATSWIKNNYSSEEWTLMQSYGAVFLPASGLRNGKKLDGEDEGKYWGVLAKTDLSYSESSCAYNNALFSFGKEKYNNLSCVPAYYYHWGYSVRLVQDVE